MYVIQQFILTLSYITSSTTQISPLSPLIGTTGSTHLSRKHTKTTSTTTATSSSSQQLTLHSASSNQHHPSSSSSNGPHQPTGDNLDPFDHLNMFQNLSSRPPTPKDDYILPQSTHPINGTFRNPPGECQHTISMHPLNPPSQHTFSRTLSMSSFLLSFVPHQTSI